MAGIVCEERTDADPVTAAVRSLTTSGAFVMPCGEVTRNLRAGPRVWARFGRHWEDLAPDPYAEAAGVRRLRRYGQFLLHDGSVHRMPDRTFTQPDDSNPLYVGQDRDFAPLTEAFARDPLLNRLIELLGRVATVLDDVAEWNVKVHPFRVRSVAGDDGLPTPQGIHLDGVTLVSALLVGRCNAVGGESTGCDDAGRPLFAATLTEPGELLLGDDRCSLHGVSRIRPLDPRAPAQRDVLVVTLASLWP